MAEPFLELDRHRARSYPGVVALDGVSLVGRAAAR